MKTNEFTISSSFIAYQKKTLVLISVIVPVIFCLLILLSLYKIEMDIKSKLVAGIAVVVSSFLFTLFMLYVFRKNIKSLSDTTLTIGENDVTINRNISTILPYSDMLKLTVYYYKNNAVRMNVKNRMAVIPITGFNNMKTICDVIICHAPSTMKLIEKNQLLKRSGKFYILIGIAGGFVIFLAGQIIFPLIIHFIKYIIFH